MFDGVTTLMPLYLERADSIAISDVAAAAQSVLEQGCDIRHELLIVDDGSPVEIQLVPELAPLLSQPGVRVLRLSQNRGLTYALNAGLTQASYELIARIDADDVWRPNKLQLQLDEFRSDPELTLVATGMRLVHRDVPARDRDELRGGTWEKVLAFVERLGCPFPHGSILARKEVFQLLGGYPHAACFTHCEDFALWSSWVRFFKVSILDEVLFEYSISGTQVSGRFRDQQQQGSCRIHEAFLKLGNVQRIPEAVTRIAALLGVNVFAASRLLCAVWMHYDNILTDKEMLEPARILFPDRSVRPYEEATESLADRFFYLHAGQCDPEFSQHARSVHTGSDWNAATSNPRVVAADLETQCFGSLPQVEFLTQACRLSRKEFTHPSPAATIDKTDIDPPQQDIQHLSREELRLSSTVSDLAETALRLRFNPHLWATESRKSKWNRSSPDRSPDGLVHELRASMVETARELAGALHANQALKESLSWKITAPLRRLFVLSRIISRIARRGGIGLVHPDRLAGFAQWLLFREQIRRSALFDQDFYLKHNPDVFQLGIGPLFHFMLFGGPESRNPHPLFDVNYYRQSNSDLAHSRINPLLHYLKWGAREGRDPHPLFDTAFYRDQNPDVRQSGVNPLLHYLAPGVAEGRDPSSRFHTIDYLEKNPHIAAAGRNPLIDYIETESQRVECGSDEGVRHA